MLISRTTGPNLTLPEIQTLVTNAERSGFQLLCITGVTYQDVPFNHLVLNEAPTLPNNGPFTKLVQSGAGAQALKGVESSVYILGRETRIKAVREGA